MNDELLCGDCKNHVFVPQMHGIKIKGILYSAWDGFRACLEGHMGTIQNIPCVEYKKCNGKDFVLE